MIHKNMRRWFCPCLLAPVLLLAGCAGQPGKVYDPLEGYNRAAFQFNEDFNAVFMQPVVGFYQLAVPKPGRTGVRNFFNNIYTIPNMGNDILQFNWRYFGNDLGRFILNTTVGVFGLVDVASKVGLTPHTQSFGLTLAKWGLWRNPPYLVLPLLGPSNMRDAFGLGADLYMNPVTYVQPSWVRHGSYGLYLTQLATDTLPQMNAITTNAIDPYVAIRSAYLQNRHYVIKQIDSDGQVSDEEREAHHNHHELGLSLNFQGRDNNDQLDAPNEQPSSPGKAQSEQAQQKLNSEQQQMAAILQQQNSSQQDAQTTSKS